MSLVVIRRKLAAKKRQNSVKRLNNNNNGEGVRGKMVNESVVFGRGGISSGDSFNLDYTNTGALRMGRSQPKFRGFANSYVNSAKYRRTHCCPKNENTPELRVPCMPSNEGIASVPIKQMSTRNRLKRLKTVGCSTFKCPTADVLKGYKASTWKLSPGEEASSVIERNAAAELRKEKHGCTFNYNVTVVKDTDNTNKFVIDGNPNLKLIFQVGNKYIFDFSDNSNTGHNFILKDKNENDEYNQLLTNGTFGTDAKVTFTPEKKGELTIECLTNGHTGMGTHYGDITVLDSLENLRKNKKCTIVKRSQNSLLSRRKSQCGIMSKTKEVKKNAFKSASDHIRKVKSETLNADCITSIKGWKHTKTTGNCT